MLSVSSYDRSYVDGCRAAFDAQLAAWEAVAATASGKAVAAFEPRFCTTLVLALDHYFLHRGRGQEGKDGNPLNEVRMLCTSIMSHGGVVTEDKTIRYRPTDAVLELAIGDEIRLAPADVALLAKAFFAEIESRFP
jgi:hypothetical protein